MARGLVIRPAQKSPQESNKLIHGQPGLPDDPEQESPVDILAAMDGHDCSTAVGMNESDVAPR